ncbi:MAG: hypothetical protein ACXWKG_02480 [Limisphaerales bacterium]
MKTNSPNHHDAYSKTLSKLAVLLCLALAIPSTRSAPVVDTVTKLEPSDPMTNQFFGTSVAIDNGTAAVGALNDPFGAVYIYDLVGGNWVQTQKVVDATPVGLPVSFGASVALQGDLLVVGQPQGFFNENFDLSGQVFIFRRIGGVFVYQQKLLELDPPPPQSGFGTAVALSGTTIAVGNPMDPNGPGSGAVSIFTNNGTSWNLQAKITAPVGTFQAFFGVSVALDGNTLLAGANQVGVSGAAYVFVRSGTTWTLQQTLLSPVPHTAEDFGTSVALQGDTGVVGAPGLASPLAGGAVFIFHHTGSNWGFQQELQGTDGTNSALSFGNSVSILNGTIVVGAPFRMLNGQRVGGADVFEFNGTSWVLAQHLVAPDPSAEAQFGHAVDIGPSGIIVGAPLDSHLAPNAGSAYIFSSSATNGPVIVSATAAPNVLFPPNHKLVPITITVNALNDVSCKIVSVSSNQPINGKGDGNTSPDWIITGDLTLLLRAERAGNIKTDRVYTITVECADAFGNTARQNVVVTVPHDQGK